MPTTYEGQSKTKLIAGLAAIVLIAGAVMAADHEKSENRQGIVGATSTVSAVQPATSSTNTSTTTTGASTTSTYKDGTYSATSEYYVPHGTEQIQASVTIKNGIITASSVTNSESNQDSALFQENFAATYKSYVVGKSISGLSLRTISGASDTTQGFNDALSKIATQAQA